MSNRARPTWPDGAADSANSRPTPQGADGNGPAAPPANPASNGRPVPAANGTPGGTAPVAGGKGNAPAGPAPGAGATGNGPAGSNGPARTGKQTGKGGGQGGNRQQRPAPTPPNPNPTPARPPQQAPVRPGGNQAPATPPATQRPAVNPAAAQRGPNTPTTSAPGQVGPGSPGQPGPAVGGGSSAVGAAQSTPAQAAPAKTASAKTASGKATPAQATPAQATPAQATSAAAYGRVEQKSPAPETIGDRVTAAKQAVLGKTAAVQDTAKPAAEVKVSKAEAKATSRAAAKASTRPQVRKARLRLSRLDPWSVMKTAFLLSIAFGIVTWVAVFIVWSAIGAAGVFENINNTVTEVLGTPTAEPFRLENYINTGKVMGFTTVVACADVLIITALATLGSFLYNIAATLLGGLEVTLASED